MSAIDTAFKNIGELKIWFNDQSGAALTLADMPEVIPLRWIYFRDNWEFILGSLTTKLNTYAYPDILSYQINSLGNLIRIQRNDVSKRINPFLRSNILNTYYAVWENIGFTSIPQTK